MRTCSKCSKTYGDDLEVCPDDNSPLESDPMLGKLLAGRFLITEKIGQGGMGAVYKAIQTKIDRLCAVKLLNPSTANSESAVSRFNREAQMASRIDSSHAVTIYDFGEADGGALYLAMEYVDGEPLSKLISRASPLPVQRVVRIVRQVAEALRAAHALGIVHRDLKPDNVMITQKGAETDYVKVLDFGIAKTVADEGAENLTQTGFVLGTPVYMSPEQLSGEKLDGRSDVYSLAIIAYEMLSGRLPFEGDNPRAIMIKRVTTEPTPVRAHAPSLGEYIERAVMAGLARDRSLRTATVERFAADLDDALAPKPATAGRAQPARLDERASHTAVSRPGRETVPDIDSDSFKTVAEQAVPVDSLTPCDGAESAVLIDAQVDTPDRDRSTNRYLPPSAYVTRASSRPLDIAQQPPSLEVEPEVEPASGVSGATQSTSPVHGSEPDTSPQRSLYETSRRRAPAAEPQTPIPEYAPVRRAVNKKVLVVITAICALAIIGAVALGYFIYIQESGTQSLPGDGAGVSSTKPARVSDDGATDTAAGLAGHPTGTGHPSDLQAATAHYESGLKHQEQAALLGADSKTEAAEEHKKAIAEYRQAIAARPNYPEAHENLGVSLYYAGEIRAALEEYRIAIDQFNERNQPPPAHVFTNYALALFDLGRYREAADAFGQALQNDPSDYDLYAHRGFALQNAGEYEAAKADYKDYLRVAASGQYAGVVRRILAGRLKPPADSGNH